ncbi:MAG: MotA/TolQ/ExbB proton channel family protein [Pseudomonadota bacterium]
METIVADLLTYVDQGGFIMPPLMLATVVLWFAIGVRFSLLVRGRKRSVRVMVDKRARGKLNREKGIVDEAVRIAFDELGKDRDRLRAYLEDQFHPFEIQLRQYRRLIGAIVAVAPLMGLLGTVVGMIETFESLGDMSLFSQSGGIAGGISQALFTTQMGLAVAIPGLLAKGYLDRREQQIRMDLAQVKDIVCAMEAKVAA